MTAAVYRVLGPRGPVVVHPPSRGRALGSWQPTSAGPVTRQGRAELEVDAIIAARRGEAPP